MSAIAPTLQVEVHDSPAVFALDRWRALVAEHPAAHVFATPEWHELWWERFGAGRDLVVLTFSRGAETIAVLPLYAEREGAARVLRFVGGIDLTDYLGPIAHPRDQDEVAHELVRWLRETDLEWDEFDAHSLPVPFGFAEHLVDHADAAGIRFALEQEEVSAILTLADGWDAYLAALPSKERHELKRKIRRFEREAPGARIRRATSDTLAADLEGFIDLHRGAAGAKGDFMSPEVASFFRRMGEVFMPLGWLSLDLLEDGDRILAGTFSFVYGDTFYLYNSAFDVEMRRLSPGLFLVAGLISRSIGQQIRVFDLLRGPERYKYQLGARSVPLHNVRLFRAPGDR